MYLENENMKKVLVVGAGRMGKAISYGLLKLGIETAIYDADTQKALDTFRELNSPNSAVVNAFVAQGYDAVISAATYTANLEIAKKCIDAKVPYFDLGGHIGTSKDIQDYATANGGLVFTDLGLAPGLVNILGEFACDELDSIGDKAHTLKLRVGGLPSPYYEMGLLKYNLTWSVEGLINEYLDKCDVLFAGGHCKVSGLTDIEELRFSNHRVFEAFHTSGGLSHTLASAKRRGLTEANYKTIRYKGHAQQVAFLNEAVKGDRAKLVEMIKATTVSHEHDLVLIHVEVEGRHNRLVKQYEINPKDGFTAMQRATAFSAAAVVENVLSWLEIYGPQHSAALEYSCLEKTSFYKHMAKLGIEL